MNIFTASSPDINPDQFMSNSPASSTQNNENVEDSKFSSLVNNAEKSASRPEDKKEAYTKKEDNDSSKAESINNNNELKTEQTESRPDAGQETGDDKSDQQVSQDDQDAEANGSDLADNDVKGDEVQEAESNQAGEQTVVAVANSGDTNSSKSQINTVNGSAHINNEGKENANNLAMDEVVSGELNAEDGESGELVVDNKASNKNADLGIRDLEKISEDIDIDEELKEKIKLAATRELPDKYAKKTVIDQSDNKTIQSHINAVDPEVLEELNNFKTLQDKMLSGNTQNPAHISGIKDAFKGVSDTTLNSLESFSSNTAVNSAELAQNQAMTMASSKAALGQGNAARAAGFSELLNHVVYVAKGRNKLGVTINHEEFGKLKINVSMDKGMLNIHVNASDKVVREFLESNVQSIVESLSKDGVSVGGFSVALKDHKDNPEKKFLMESGIHRQYDHRAAAVHSARGLVNVFA
jgi:flagellar hook-length control protein FliK